MTSCNIISLVRRRKILILAEKVANFVLNELKRKFSSPLISLFFLTRSTRNSTPSLPEIEFSPSHKATSYAGYNIIVSGSFLETKHTYLCIFIWNKVASIQTRGQRVFLHPVVSIFSTLGRNSCYFGDLAEIKLVKERKVHWFRSCINNFADNKISTVEAQYAY